MAIDPTSLETLEHLAGLTEHLLVNNDITALITQPAPGKWSPLQIAAHIVSYQPTFASRLNRILTEDNPSFERYNAANDELFTKLSGCTVAELIEHQHLYRRELKTLLTGLNDEQLARTGSHTLHGSLTIPMWLEFFMLHESHHIFKMFELLHNEDEHH